MAGGRGRPSISKERAEHFRDNPQAPKVGYTDLILGAESATKFPHSTLIVLRAKSSLIPRTSKGLLRVKLASTSDSHEGNDFLDRTESAWLHLPGVKEDMTLFGDMASTSVAKGESKTIVMTKGNADRPVVLYYPHNKSHLSLSHKDDQQETAKFRFKK